MKYTAFSAHVELVLGALPCLVFLFWWSSSRVALGFVYILAVTRGERSDDAHTLNPAPAR